MAQIKIILVGNTTDKIWQVEQPLHLNPDGSAQQTLTYKVPQDSQYAAIPEYLSPHPWIDGMYAYESDMDGEPGGILRVSTTFKGILSSNPEMLGQHEFTRSVTEAPIETNARFSIPRDSPPVTADAMADIELALQNNYKKPKFSPDDGGDINAATLLFDKKRRGIESYLKPGGIFKVSYVSTNIPSIASVGRIVTPPQPCPPAPDGQNYLCMAITWDKQATIVQITEEYQLSGPGGWDPDLYDTGAISGGGEDGLITGGLITGSL